MMSGGPWGAQQSHSSRKSIRRSRNARRRRPAFKVNRAQQALVKECIFDVEHQHSDEGGVSR